MPVTTQEVKRTLKSVAKLQHDITHEIRETELALAALRKDEEKLSALVGSSVSMSHIVHTADVRTRAMLSSTPGRAPRVRSSGAKRIDWSLVLAKLPTAFVAADVKKASGKNKPSEIFAAITRWIDSGLAVKKARGEYVKKAANEHKASTPTPKKAGKSRPVKAKKAVKPWIPPGTKVLTRPHGGGQPFKPTRVKLDGGKIVKAVAKKKTVKAVRKSGRAHRETLREGAMSVSRQIIADMASHEPEQAPAMSDNDGNV